MYINIKGGKTTITNFLSEATSSSSKEYHPTQGVRILEFESECLDEDKTFGVEVELWDCAGSKKYGKVFFLCNLMLYYNIVFSYTM